jgi:anti-sigma B factor antagonist
MAPISVTLAPRDPPAAVVALVGEHDAYSSQRLENELAMLLDEGRQIVVDLRDTGFVDSTTLGVLLAARKRAEQSSLGFTLVVRDGDYTQARHILDLTGLGRSFAIYGKLDEALGAARAGRVAGRPSKAA